MKKLAMISRIKHLLDKTTLFIVINSLVFSKLYHCSSVSAGTSKSNIEKNAVSPELCGTFTFRQKKIRSYQSNIKKTEAAACVGHPVYEDTV